MQCRVTEYSGNRMNSQELWEAGFVVSTGWVSPSSHGRMELSCVNSFCGLTRNENQLLRKNGHHDPFDKEGCLVGRKFSMDAERRGEFAEKTTEDPLILPDVKVA